MKFTVTWKPSAERELASIWLASRMRPLVTAAVGRIEDSLMREPLNFGESRVGAMRVAFDDPLALTFHVNVDDRIVTVLAVWSSE